MGCGVDHTFPIKSESDYCKGLSVLRLQFVEKSLLNFLITVSYMEFGGCQIASRWLHRSYSFACKNSHTTGVAALARLMAVVWVVNERCQQDFPGLLLLRCILARVKKLF